MITAPLRWLRGGHRRHRRGLFSKMGDLMPTFSFMSFARGGQDEALPMQCERDQQPSEEAPPARVVEEEAPPPPKKRATFFGKKSSKKSSKAAKMPSCGAVARQEAREKSRRRPPPRGCSPFPRVPLLYIATTPLPGKHAARRRPRTVDSGRVGRFVTVAWPVLNFVKSCRCSSTLFGGAVYFRPSTDARTSGEISSGLCSQQHATHCHYFGRDCKSSSRTSCGIVEIVNGYLMACPIHNPEMLECFREKSDHDRRGVALDVLPLLRFPRLTLSVLAGRRHAGTRLGPMCRFEE